jgi:hypothetical protein
MTKNDLKLLHSFIDNKAYTDELNYMLVQDGGFVATDTRKCIKVLAPTLKGSGLIHKKVLKGFESLVGKDDIVSISHDFLFSGLVKLPYDGSLNQATKYPNTEDIFNIQLPNHFTLNTIDDIQFELSQRDCYLDDVVLNSLIAFSDCTYFDVFYKSQTVTDNKKDNGIAKIVGQKVIDDELKVHFVATLMGRVFESKSNE